MPDRDPMIDPRPGDVWQIDPWTTIEIEGRLAGGRIVELTKTTIGGYQLEILREMLEDARLITRGAEMPASASPAPAPVDRTPGPGSSRDG